MGKELLFKALRAEQCERAPWVPFVGVHGAHLIGCNAESYLKSKQKIVEGVSAAIERYKPDGIPVVFDLQLEAEALGCSVIWADENPPSVTGHPLQDGATLDDLSLPNINQGRIGIVMEAAEELKALYPNVALYGLVTGPFTLALHLMGTDIFMQMFTDEDYIHRVLAFCQEVAKTMCRYYSQAGCDVIAVVDPMTSQISTEHFNSFVSKYAAEIFSYIRESGRFSSFFVCGDAQHNIEAMCSCKPDNVSVDENIPLDYVRDICLERGISFGGNLKLTTTLLLGAAADCEFDALDCLETGGNRGFIIAPGCDLPYKTDPQNLIAVKDVIMDDYRRDVVKALFNGVKGDIKEEKIYKEPLEYTSDKIIVDVVTLDSLSCAPCQYMMGVVLKAAEGYKDRVIVREHKIKESEGLEMMSRLNVKKIPSICIQGKLCFSSITPSVEALGKLIQEQL